MKIAIYSNPPYSTSGYGQQTFLTARKFIEDGHDVVVTPNCGALTNISFEGINVLPEGVASFSFDAAPEDILHHIQQDGYAIILMDMWPLNNCNGFDQFRSICWTPVDHDPCPPPVVEYLKRPNKLPVAMTQFGQELLHKAGFKDVNYIPLSVDTRLFRDLGMGERTKLNVPQDAYLVVTNAANRGHSPIRKGFGEMADVMKRFMDDRPDVYWFIHTEYRGYQNGVNLPRLLTAAGVDTSRVMYPEPRLYRLGMPPEYLAAMYSSANCILALSMGEGFGIPSSIEAPACGCPAVVTNFTCQPEFITPYGKLVKAQRFWDEPQQSWFGVANIEHGYQCMQELYEETKAGQVERGIISSSVQKFDTNFVYQNYWKSLLNSLEAHDKNARQL